MAGTASPHDREAIMRAAVQLTARHGTAAVEDILRVAHVNRRIFYRHFASKDALLAELAAEAAEAVGQELAAAVSGAPDGAGAARAWVGHYLELVRDEGAATSARSYLAPDPTAGTTVAAAVEAGHDRHRELLEDALRRGRADGSLPATDPEGDAFVVQAAVLRYAGLHLHGHPSLDAEAAAAAVTGALQRLGGASGPP
ncbi:TetR/AcrR family transcriptional regulator [Pseudonocardia sp. CA-107938]|uniref:TetR/AcrR family transcriptional regulator n=1 Tax=Pseudonocardia sp. CA-107938 TaxID=3240021 RepID=UPI003D8CB926